MVRQIPFARLGIPKNLRENLSPDAPKALRLATARGLVPTTADVQLAMCYALTGDPDPDIMAAAHDTIAAMPVDRVIQTINIRTHPKVLEYLVETRDDPDLDDRVAMHKLANDRTVRKIARRAGPMLAEKLSLNHERLLMTPAVYIDLHANPNVSDRDLQRAQGFLRMEKLLPNVPAQRPGPAGGPTGDAAAATQAEMDLQAEIMAAIAGEQSPALLAAQETRLEMFNVDDDDVDLGGFAFDFSDDSEDLSWVLTQDRESRASVEEIRSIEATIQDMSPGQKIKLAYLGNLESRKILLRDSNKLIASAVVKSGRMSDGEGLAAAGNKNLADDVIREVAGTREWVRKYPFQVALVNNPKCPVATAMGFIRSLNRHDLQALARNRNLASAVTQAASRLYKSKFQRS
ncbi:MAG: hypothetical protein GXP62_13525 [Oligoflexia bacterium]|nr:hypothetical protein [Oligoflexia bacterium]